MLVHTRAVTAATLGVFLSLAPVYANSVPTAMASAVSTQQYITYRVKKGDTLYDLAKKYKSSINAIAKASGISEDARLQVGKTLRIPVKVTPSAPQAPAQTAKATAEPTQPGPAPTPPAQAEPVPPAAEPEALASRGGSRGAVAIAWAEAQEIFPRGGKATVTDVKTGLRFVLVRRGGWAHADVEPATKTDTATVKKIWGTWSWTRRPVVVEVSDKRIAASMAGMPHGEEVVVDNGVYGHFDLHFLNSTTHGSVYTKNRKPTLDKAHQAAVQEAVGK